MNKEQLTNLIINSPSINATLNNLNPEYLRDEMKQYFLLLILEKPEEELLAIYNKCNTCLEHYAGSIIKLQFKSSTSPFFKQYRQENRAQNAKEQYYDLLTIDTTEVATAHTEEEINIKRIKQYLDSIPPKKSIIFSEYYFKGKTLKEIAKKYKMKYTTVRSIIKTTEQLLRDNVTYYTGE